MDRELGEAFEDQEPRVPGGEGFEHAVVEIARIETTLGINARHQRSAFTPHGP